MTEMSSKLGFKTAWMRGRNGDYHVLHGSSSPELFLFGCILLQHTNSL